MEHTCVICFDAMDMNEFADERESTQTCIKLDCGHAYHTRCIIQCLSSMNQKCPNCNKDKGPAHELTRDGIVRQILSEIKKDDTMKYLLNEHTESRNELIITERQLMSDVKEFIVQRKLELEIDTKRKYFMSCLSQIQSYAKKYTKSKGPQFTGALYPTRVSSRYYSSWNGSYFEQIMFGRARARADNRLKYPYLRMRLY